MVVRFEQLLATVESRGVLVLRYGRLSPDEAHGDYKRREGRTPPVIRIVHEGRFDLVTEPNDTITLAHEFGHHLSCEAGEHTSIYAAAIAVAPVHWPSLSAEQRSAVFEEEVRAWRFARSFLASLGQTDFAAFDAQRDASLAIYVEMLAPDGRTNSQGS